jgi:uncharacterized protein YhaN
MKVKEFFITRYGPLGNNSPFRLANFNLFFGKNEEGKTLTIDALVKLLLERDIKGFEHIDRVKENPEGYVIVEEDKDKEIKLPEKGNLSEFTGLTSSECRNIFVIRNSDLSIARESEFYTNVTDRLTGLRTEDISLIKKKLQELGKLTRADSTAELSDKKDFGNVKSRVNDAYKLLGEIDRLQEEIRKEKFDELEELSVETGEEQERIKQQTESLEDARKREKYEKGKEALDNLKKSLEELKGLEIYNEEDGQLWRDCEKDIKTFDGRKKELLAELKEKENRFKETSEKLSEVKRDFRVFNERKRKIDDGIKRELEKYEMGVEEAKSEETKNKFYIVAAIASAILLSISILGVITNPLPIFYGLIALFLASTAIFVGLRFSLIQKRAHLNAVFERIKLACSKFELDAENAKEIYSKIQKFEEEHDKRTNKLQEMKREKENLEGEIKKLREERIPKEKRGSEDAKDKIEKIKIKSGEDSLEEYAKKLNLKQSLEELKGKQESILGSHLGKKSEKIEENISYWDEEIRNLEEYKDKAEDLKYSETVVSELKETKQKLEEKLRGINDKMVSLRGKMREVERKANEILRLEAEYLYCKASVDLGAVKDKLEGFIDENENNKNSVLEVMKIFEEIEAEEREKVSELFGKDSSVSKYFNEITNGLYEEVTFNQEIEKIEVKRRDGVILEAEKLSGGAYDQLYLSIRLALGEKLLKSKKGFFIMDDPFIKADPDRLQRQIETLKKISESGWQIMYFSAKGEIKDALKGDISCGTINYIEIQSIFS